MTDANLLLGYLDPGSPLAGGVELDRGAAEAAIEALARELGLSLIDTAAGVVRVASAAMAQAVRVVTVERGVDPRELTLIPFGGAGPLHGAQIADELGMRRVLVPVASGVLSALGLIVSERRRDLVESVLMTGAELSRENISAAVARLAARGREELGAEDVELRATYELRYAGQAFELAIQGDPEPEPASLRRAFGRAHTERYGYEDREGELELVTIRVTVALPGAEAPPGEPAHAAERGEREAVFEGRPLATSVRRGAGAELDGPAIVELPGSTLVVPPGWRARGGGDAVSLERR